MKKKPQKQGKFLATKRMVLTDYKVLGKLYSLPFLTRSIVPSFKAAPTIPVFNLHDNLPESDSREHLDEVEIPDIDLTNYDNASLGFILNENIEKPKFRLDDVKRMINEIPDDVTKLEAYIDNVNLDDQPTNVLVKLAEKMKRRRKKLYKDLRNPDSSSSDGSSEEE